MSKKRHAVPTAQERTEEAHLLDPISSNPKRMGVTRLNVEEIMKKHQEKVFSDEEKTHIEQMRERMQSLMDTAAAASTTMTNHPLFVEEDLPIIPELMRALPLPKYGIDVISSLEHASLNYLLAMTPLINTAIRITPILPMLVERVRGKSMITRAMDSHSVIRIYMMCIRFLLGCSADLAREEGVHNYPKDTAGFSLMSYRYLLAKYLSHAYHEERNMNLVADILVRMKENLEFNELFMSNTLLHHAMVNRKAKENPQMMLLSFDAVIERCRPSSSPEESCIDWLVLQVIIDSITGRVNFESVSHIIVDPTIYQRLSGEVTPLEIIHEEHEKNCLQLNERLCDELDRATSIENAEQRRNQMALINHEATLRLVFHHEDTLLKMLSQCTYPSPAIDPQWIEQYHKEREHIFFPNGAFASPPAMETIFPHIAMQLYVRRLRIRHWRRQFMYTNEQISQANAPQDDSELSVLSAEEEVNLPDGLEERIMHIVRCSILPDPSDFDVLIQWIRIHVPTPEILHRLHLFMIRKNMVEKTIEGPNNMLLQQ